MSALDINGQKFGRLTVLKRTENNRKGSAVWACRCDCGNEVKVVGYRLRNGHTKSCGCYMKEQTSKARSLKLEGQRFGKLTALSAVDRRVSGLVLWLCKCDCGETVEVCGKSLKGGKTKSCGCYQKEQTSKAKAIDLVGQRFGRLIVFEKAGKTALGNLTWKCRCDCGEIKVLRGSHLKSGATTSCGCYQKERTSAASTIHGLSKTKGYRRAKDMQKHASRSKRTPKWSDLEKIQEFYSNTEDGYHVDHIIPLQGRLVSGLHVPENLQYLAVSDNLKKSNKFTPYSEVRSTGEVALIK